ncbi:MAG: FAD-binding oxidoreductase [Alphaproteobacteria bacterium]|nr:FAD-binding oxidoreductase [Alphaproteobacteria bacterium]MBM3733933.1 FAD-binding oxidoreductase [Acidimicrobiia bacterium]
MAGAHDSVDVAVVGAGVIGATIALFLARGGMKVALIDRGLICRQASGVNAGTLTMQMTRVALIPFALRAHHMWATAPQWLGHEVGVVVCEGLSVAFTDGEAELLAERAAKRRTAGAPIELVDGARAGQIEPGLSDQVKLAGHCRVDGFANAYLTGIAYRRALVDAGASIRENTRIVAAEEGASGYVLRAQGGAMIAARRVVLAGGVWLQEMAAWFGQRLPIKCLINQLAVTERLAPVMRTVLGIASGLLSLKQYPHGTVVIGGGWQGIGDPVHGPRAIVPENFLGNVRLASHTVPRLMSGRIVRAWLGLEAETADALPAVGALPGHPHVLVCGSVHSGYTSGPYIAKLLAEQMLGHAADLSLQPFDVARLIEGANSPTMPP